MLPAISFQQRHRLIAWHLELHPVPCRDIERKHFRVDLRRADRLVSHQALQHLQRDAGIQHVHPVAVTERVRGNRYRKRHPVGGSRINGFTYPGPDRPVCDFPCACLLRSAGAFIKTIKRKLKGVNHHF